MKLRLTAAIAAASLSMLSAGAASAGVTEINAGLDAMSQYNLIVRGDLQSKHEVEGRTFVGGNATGASNYNVDGIAGGYGLRVVGDVKDGWKSVKAGDIQVGGNVSQINFGGQAGGQDLTYGGTLSSMNVNSPDTATKVSGLGATMGAEFDTMVSNLTTLSTYLAGLTPTETVDLVTASNKAIFDATTSNNVAVFSIENLSGFANRQINYEGLSDYDLVVINVTGSGPMAVSSSTNFASEFGAGTNVIWNFTNATSLNFGAQNWFGSVLALNTTDVWNDSAIEGSMVFGGVFHQNGEVHTDTFGDFRFPPPPETPGVPEPATWAMMILGFGAAGAVLRRRRTLVAA